MKQEITQYYNDLATDYDKNRFANSYGKYIHLQETQILDKYITLNDISKNLDIACGTGRFLNYADYGIDKVVKWSESHKRNSRIKILQ